MKSTPGTRRNLATLLQVASVLIGLGTLGFLLGEPHLEGRNAHASIDEIYFHDPFLAYVYAGSLPFFVALRRAYALGGDVRRGGRFSPASLSALRTIKRCALALLAFLAGGVMIILRFGDRDDRPAGLFMSLLVVLAASAIFGAATLVERALQRAFHRNDADFA